MKDELFIQRHIHSLKKERWMGIRKIHLSRSFFVIYIESIFTGIKNIFLESNREKTHQVLARWWFKQDLSSMTSKILLKLTRSCLMVPDPNLTKSCKLVDLASTCIKDHLSRVIPHSIESTKAIEWSTWNLRRLLICGL